MEIAFRQLKERLEREGLFDPRRKRPLPRIPERVAVVTSPTGAAIRDILQTLRRRFPAVEVLVYPVRVQGEGAAGEIAAAIDVLSEHAEALGVEVAIVGRGGGSLEDLWAFNEEVVARAIAASRIPIISAVGHEVDVTISDLVADMRAATPTAAAELLTPTRAELLVWLGRQLQRAARTLTHTVQLAHATFAHILARAPLARPLTLIGERAQLLDELQQRLRLAATESTRRLRQRLSAAELTLLRFRTGARFVQAERDLERRLHRLLRALNAQTLRCEHRLGRSLTRLEHATPRPQLKRSGEHLHHARQRLEVALRQCLLHRRNRLAARTQAVVACDPRHVLRRGYSITRDAQTRQILRSIDRIRAQMRISIELADGEFHATTDDPKQAPLFDAPP